LKTKVNFHAIDSASVPQKKAFEYPAEVFIHVGADQAAIKTWMFLLMLKISTQKK
jgi:hypothetical protein